MERLVDGKSEEQISMKRGASPSLKGDSNTQTIQVLPCFYHIHTEQSAFDNNAVSQLLKHVLTYQDHYQPNAKKGLATSLSLTLIGPVHGVFPTSQYLELVRTETLERVVVVHEMPKG